ncbi:MAG: MarR family transcriptional regulator [Proteobacteria bacterium]|nr:MarR family transcriptional regulator [Pseudomonadota bacterium]
MMKRSKYTEMHTPAGEAFTELIIETFRLNGCLITEGDKLTGDFGLSSARWQVMGAIFESPLTASQIARKMGLKRQSVQRIVNVLFQDGFVVFRDNPDHRRAKLVELTEHGNRILKKANRRQIDWVNEIARRLDADDLKRTVRTLQTLRTRLEAS